MAQPEIYQLGDNGANVWPYVAMGNNGGFGNGNFWGAGIGGFLGSALGNWLGGNGWNGNGNGNAAAAALGAQATANNNTDLIIQAVTSQGEQSRQATQTLSTMLGQDFNLVNAGIQTMQSALCTIAGNQGMNVQQVINALERGDAALQAQFCQCCCENKLAICQQTNELQRSMDGINQNITATRAAQELSDCKQTYTLTETMNRNYQLLDNKIDMLESQRKDREIAAKDAEIATLKSQNFTTSVIGQAVAPINAALAALHNEVDDIKCKMPNTVSVQYPNLQVVNATPYVNGGYYGQTPFFGGFGYNGGIF